jgi:hypothetical protein
MNKNIRGKKMLPMTSKSGDKKVLPRHKKHKKKPGLED